LFAVTACSVCHPAEIVETLSSRYLPAIRQRRTSGVVGLGGCWGGQFVSTIVHANEAKRGSIDLAHLSGAPKMMQPLKMLVRRKAGKKQPHESDMRLKTTHISWNLILKTIMTLTRYVRRLPAWPS
jgi:hypothetical protein